MTCPHCHASLEPASIVCGSCGFEMTWVIRQLGDDLVKLERLSDRAHCLRLTDSRHLNSVLDEFEAHFPQVFAAVYFAVLPSALSLNELTFWLLNHAAFDTCDIERQNEFAMVLVIDPVAKTAAINVGYALERVLPPRFLLGVLNGMRTPLWHAEYVEAVELALGKISRRLRHVSRRVVPSQEISPPETTEDFLKKSGLDPLKRTLSSWQSRAVLTEVEKDWP